MQANSYYSFKTIGLNTFLAIALIGSSCNSETPSTTESQEKSMEMADSSNEVAADRNDARFENNMEDDATFMSMVAESNMLKIQLGQLAQKNAISREVKDLGSMMEKEHTKSLADLKAMAEIKQVNLPTMLSGDGQACKTKMMTKNGTEFEKEYCNKMVETHEESIEKFEKAAKDAKDPDLKAWATTMLPLLRKHLDEAITCQKMTDKKS